jgi:hypothetical protein
MPTSTMTVIQLSGQPFFHARIAMTSCYFGCMAEDSQRFEVRLSITALVLGTVQGDAGKHSLYID